MLGDTMRMIRVLAVLLAPCALATAPGCSCSDPGGGSGKPCRVDSECPDSEICIDNKCQKADDDEDGGPDPDCTDADDDGVCAEDDCNDADPVQTGEETCDGADNDCDGEVDEGVLNTCGNCDPGCEATGLGPSEGGMFDLDMDDNDGVGLDDDGALILDSESINTDYIWIANTGGSQVVKVDTDTYEEIGRYWTDTDPSRTTVNTAGDVYVGNRNGQSVTKISVLGEDCPDTNGDGTITTSAGGGDVIGGGPGERFQDDCVLWHTELPDHGIIRAMAAQDVEGADGELRPYVWAGGWDGWVYKLDGETGEVLVETQSPVQTYGFALDAEGRLWISGINGGLGMIDTTRCVDDTSCAVDICRASSAEGTECDDAVKAEIPIPGYGYGITVDFAQRVWLGGWNGSPVTSYEPAAASGSRWRSVSGGLTNCNGVAADAEGFVYAACESSNAMMRINADTLDHRVISTDNNRGIAVDADGKIWGINRHSDAGSANVLDPGAAIDDNPVDVNVAPVLASPYTYSDMTGLQLRLATNPRGYYRHLFEGCPEGAETTWGELTWEAETPAGTSVTFRVKTADTRDALDAMDWITVAQQPPDAPPADIDSALMDAGVTPGRLLMLEVILQAERMSTTEVITPRVLGMNVERVCPPDFG